MSNGSDLAVAKLEFVREITVAYLNNVYPKPLTALSEESRQKTIEQQREEINGFIKSVYSTINRLKIAPSAK